MRTVTIRLEKKDEELVARLKGLGFGSAAEIIRCAAVNFGRCLLRREQQAGEPGNSPPANDCGKGAA